MRKFRQIIIIGSVILLIVFLAMFDYSNPWTRSNHAVNVGIVAVCLNIIAMILSNRHDEKAGKK
ncbi:MAG TPA: hypothetical protein PLO24_06865 [Bacteroidales bacterium]|jgi:hypothetical protein|nr:hypothetical protein [Bacteroidales bacterium]HOS71740.1 hypothetical protein [Bacteroidales bacterium]HQH24935.1 hypothetical protein [Bacteroidales bacterium]HQJ82339.1 hypothetical protein [Bacteroidales bacterium]